MFERIGFVWFSFLVKKKSSLVETFFTEINCRIDAELTLYNGGNYYSLDCDFYKINLIGHGCTIMSNDVEKLKNVEFVSRKLPEKMFNN